MLTITEIARRINIPDSTARYYRDQFEAWLPVLGAGRDRRYGDEAVDVLRFVAESAKAKLPVELIKQRLDERFPVVTRHDESQPPATTDNDEQSQEIAQAPSVLAMFALVVRELLAEQQSATLEEIRALRLMVAESADADRKTIAEQAGLIGSLKAQLSAAAERHNDEQQRAAELQAEVERGRRGLVQRLRDWLG